MRLALLHLAILGYALGLVAISDDEERVAGVGHGFEAEDFNWSRGAGFFDGAAAIVEHGADFAEGIADDVAVVEAQGAVLDKHGRYGTASAIELGFNDRADSLAARSGFGRADVGDQADHFKQQVEIDALLGGDFDENGAFLSSAGPLFRNQAAIGELLLDAIGIGFRLVDLVDCHDDGHVRRPWRGRWLRGSAA